MSDTLHPTNPAALRTLAEAGHWERVLDLAEPMIAEDPDSAELHGLAGQAALRLDQHRRAKSHLTTCLNLEPDDTWPHCLMAEMYSKEKRALYAKRHLETALSMEPENGHTWLQFGWNCASRGDWITAKQAAENARSLLPENASVASFEATMSANSEGEHSTKGDAFAQLDEFRKALELDPEDDFVHYQMGEIYFEQLGDLDNAEECHRTALNLDPNDKHYRHALFRTLRRRDPLLKILYGPMHLHEEAEAAGRPAVLTMGLVALTAPFFLVPAKFYEHMVLTDLRRGTGQMSFDESGFAGAYRWPFYFRFAGFGLLTAGFLTALIWFLFSPTVAPYRGEILGGAFINFLIVGFVVAAKRPHQE
jgi:tetratricopeptide (TPR) repeat protein